MATIIGRNAKVAISANGSSYTEIGKIKSAKLSIKDDTADETTNDSAGYKEEKFADSQATLDLGMKYNKADAGQALLVTAKTGKTIYYFRVRPQASSGENEFIFQGVVTDLTIDTQTGQVEDMSATIVSTGSITTQNQ